MVFWAYGFRDTPSVTQFRVCRVCPFLYVVMLFLPVVYQADMGLLQKPAGDSGGSEDLGFPSLKLSLRNYMNSDNSQH